MLCTRDALLFAAFDLLNDGSRPGGRHPMLNGIVRCWAGMEAFRWLFCLLKPLGGAADRLSICLGAHARGVLRDRGSK